MPIVKMQNRHCACSRPKGIQWYIEEKREGRCLARAFLNVNDWDQPNWARAFDRRRIAEGNDLPYRGKPAIQYVHAEVAPDPRDNVSVEEMVAFAKEWAAPWFGSDFEPGKLGRYQVAIGIHDDSENGIMHAHLVINNTDLDTGKRLHFSDKNNREVKRHAQDLARKRGWHYFDNTPDQKWIKSEAGLPMDERRAMLPSGTPPTLAERRMLERGEGTWKSLIRNRVIAAREISRTEDEFLETCERLGLDVVESANGTDNVYRMEVDGSERAVAGSNLGRGWKGYGVEGRVTVAKRLDGKNAEQLRSNVLEAFDRVRVWEVEARGLAEHEIAATLMTMHQWNVSDASGFEVALERCKDRLNVTQGKENEAYRRQFAKLKRAEETAAKMGLLKDVTKSERAKAATQRQGHVDGRRSHPSGAGKTRGRTAPGRKGGRSHGGAPRPNHRGTRR